MTTTLSLRACPRCEAALVPYHDQHGDYWQCLRCGHHGYANVPSVARIARAEAAKGYNSVFDYCGPEKTFKGLRIRGRLLSMRESQTFARFDLTCPYRGCTKRQLVASKERHAGVWAYECKNRHRIRLNVDELTWY